MNTNALRYQIEQTVIGRGRLQGRCGGIFVGGEIIKSAQTGTEDVRCFIDEVQKQATSPLLIAGDLEAGCGDAIPGLTKLPSLMGLGATHDPALAYQYGYITGREAKSVGLNWAFAPVVDLNVNPHNSVVSIRSIGDDPDEAIPMLKAVVQGMQDAGMAACIKHFPGDGVDWRDQHVTTTCNSLSWEEYMTRHGRVFQELASVAYTVMVGHITLPAFQQEKLGGHYPPATLSRELMVELLRKELGFEGLTVSDALDMGGYLGWHKTETESQVLSFKNGCDMMLWPTDQYVEELVSAVECGYVPRKRVEEAFQRIEALRQKLGLYDDQGSNCLTALETAQHAEVWERLYPASIAVECDTEKQLPFGPEVKKVAVIPVRHTEHYARCVNAAVEELTAHGVAATVYSGVWIDNFPRILEENDKVLFLLFSQPHKPNGPVDFSGWEDVGAIWASTSYGNEKTVTVAFGAPYFKNQYFERACTYINAFSPDKYAVKTVIKGIFGEVKLTGKTPVKL